MMQDMRETIASVLRSVTPEDVLSSMGIKYGLRWEGRRSWHQFTPKEEHIVRMLSGPLHDMSCEVAVRTVKVPEFGKGQAQIEWDAHQYLRRLVDVRNKFARRAWRRLSALAC